MLLSHRSLAVRLLRVIFGCYFAVAVVVTAVQMFTEYRSAHQRLEADIQTMQRTFGRGLADAMWSFNAGVLHGILNGVAEMPVVVGVEVHDEHGAVLDSIENAANRSHDLTLFDHLSNVASISSTSTRSSERIRSATGPSAPTTTSRSIR